MCRLRRRERQEKYTRTRRTACFWELHVQQWFNVVNKEFAVLCGLMLPHAVLAAAGRTLQLTLRLQLFLCF